MPRINLSGSQTPSGGGSGVPSGPSSRIPAGTGTASGGASGGPLPAGTNLLGAQSQIAMLSRIEGVLRTQVGVLQQIASYTRATYMAVGQMQSGAVSGSGSGSGATTASVAQNPKVATSASMNRIAASTRSAYQQSGISRVTGMAGGYSGFGALGALGALDSPVGIGVAALGAALFAPQLTSGVNSVLASNTDAGRKYALGTYGMGMAGGYSSTDLMHALNPKRGSAAANANMSIGMGPQAALGLLQTYGIVQSSASGAAGLATTLGGIGLTSGTAGLAGMDTNSLIGAARQFGAYGRDMSGNISSGGQGQADQFFKRLSDIMTQATSAGLDRSTVLNTLTTAMTSAVGMGGAGGDVNGLNSYMMSFMNSGTAAGRSGALGASQLAGLQNLNANPYGTSSSGAFMTSMVTRTKTASQLSSLIGSSNFASLQQSPSGQAMISQFLDPSTPDPIKAQLLSSFWNDPGGQNSEQSAIVGWTGGLGLHGAAQASAMTGIGGGTIAGNEAVLNSGGVGAGGLGISGAYNPSDRSYASQLAKMGVPSAYISQIIQDAAAKGINPIWVGAKMMAESGGDPKAFARDKSGSYSFGLMQLDSNTYTNPAGMSWRQNLAAGVGQMASLYTRFNGDINAADAAYRNGTGAYASPLDIKYRGNEVGLIGRSGGAIMGKAGVSGGPSSRSRAASDALTLGYNQDQSQLNASLATLVNFGPAVNTFDNASTRFSAAVNAFVKGGRSNANRSGYHLEGRAGWVRDPVVTH